VCGDVIVGLMCRVGLEALYLIKMMIFSKNLALFEKSTFLPVLGRFCMRALWRGFD
jgi:hypothetical protein